LGFQSWGVFAQLRARGLDALGKWQCVTGAIGFLDRLDEQHFAQSAFVHG
jgi:hypothetical protein